jgi:two-component system sensor histidine kinase UhpB
MSKEMDYSHKTKAQLIEEIEVLRARICQLEDCGKETLEKERLLRQIKRHQGAVLNNIPDMAWLKDKNGKYLLVNRSFTEISHKSEKDIIGKKDVKIWPKDVARQYNRNDKVTMESRERRKFEEPLVGSRGKISWVESVKTPLFNEQGEVVGTVGIARDVTERKKMEEHLQRSQEQLRNLSAHLNNLRENERTRISRDINEELNQILSVLKFDLAWVDTRLNQDQAKLREKIQSMSDMITSVIEWIRRLSQELRPSLLDHLGLIPAIEWEINEFEKQTGIDCSFRARPADLKLDEQTTTSLFRILQEALSNIRVHSRASKSVIHLERKNGWIILQITDNGVGIPNEKLTDSRSIGLTSIQERVRLLQGKIKVIGTLNKGTRVSVKLPCTPGGN